MIDSIRNLAREPLLHFLLAGASLFLLYNYVSDSAPTATEEIVVTSGHVEHLTTLFLKMRQRLPTESELAGLIDDFIVEEILFREAISIGIDQNDTIIGRRLRQKMEFLFDDFSAAKPTDDELQKFLTDHPDQFRTDPTISFEQVYLTDASQAEAAMLLRELQATGRSAGDELFISGLLPPRFADASKTGIANRFGTAFADALFLLGTGKWSGPIDSPFGVHLIFIEEITPSSVPELQEIRSIVERDWLVSRRTEAEKIILDELRKKYTVSIETPAVTAP